MDELATVQQAWMLVDTDLQPPRFTVELGPAADDRP
jgi:hypothetical protein